jgi:hypothetical protein
MFNSLNPIQTYSLSTAANKGLLTASFSIKHGKRNANGAGKPNRLYTAGDFTNDCLIFFYYTGKLFISGT